MVDFGCRLKSLRTQHGMTQKEIAQKLGVTKSVVSYYELRERTPSPEMLIKLASIFRVTTDYLLGIEKTSSSLLDLSELTDDDIHFLQSVADYLREKH